MGKTYIDTVKYLIKGTVDIDGIVEKPDVVGAIFGQTEGLLADELDLRELLKSGRIGRIEVDLKINKGKSIGTIGVPSSLDKSETALIAALLETVDRIGPCSAKIKITEIEDTRSSKREIVMSRAKELMQKLGKKKTKELTEELKDSVKTAKIKLYGREKIPAGPDVETADEIIIVEGRADVISLLRAGINNVISLKGAVIPKTVVELSKTKGVILFVDGDRGGDMVVRNFVDKGKADFVAKAPDGKEVEELTQKEILKCLKNKMPFKRFAAKSTIKTPVRRERFSSSSREPRARGSQREIGRRSRPHDERPRRDSRREERPHDERPMREVPGELKKVYEKVKGTMKAVLLDKDNKAIGEVPVSEMISKIQTEKAVDKVVFDGIITQRLIDLAAKKKVNTLVGLKKAKIDHKRGVAIYMMA